MKSRAFEYGQAINTGFAVGLHAAGFSAFRRADGCEHIFARNPQAHVLAAGSP